MTVLIPTGPFPQPRFLGTTKYRTRVGRSSYFLFKGDISQEPFSNSTQIAESHGRLSEHRVEVTGLCFLINLYSLDATMVLNLSLSCSGSYCPKHPEKY